MKKLVTIILVLITFNCFSQDKDYKKAYEISKKLNTEYKLKITSLDSVIVKQDLFILDLNNIIDVNKKIMSSDSLQISLLEDQKRLLNDNINLYRKELDRRNKFWYSPAGGVVLGVIGTVAIIHIIDYSLP
mgnify:CR=1 FL=1|tara:strand:- start:554 stop:946 length:393 start_codon:yes stop_codon:yes gene_type:complete